MRWLDRGEEKERGGSRSSEPLSKMSNLPPICVVVVVEKQRGWGVVERILKRIVDLREAR